MIRSFLAIELPRSVVKQIEEVQRDLKSSHADVRWANPYQIHLTLKFFGNIEESKVDSILTSVQEPVRETPPFSLEIRGVGAFPHFKNPRVIWMGLVDGENVLQLFYKRLENSLEQVGFEPEDRPFHPHLTLGRVKSGREKGDLIGRIERYREERFGDFQVERVVLFKSDLKPTGPIYTALKDLRLGGKGVETDKDQIPSTK